MLKMATMIFLSCIVWTVHASSSAGVGRSISIHCSFLNGVIESVSVERRMREGSVAPTTILFSEEKSKHQTYTSVLAPGDVAECIYPSGSRVRLKVGEGTARGYGQCGADPEVFLSLWVNQRKVASKLWFAGHCMENEDYSFRINKMGAQPTIEKCHEVRELRGGENPPGTPAFVKAEACIELPDISYYPVDPQEYQNGSARRVVEGDHTILKGDGPVCSHVEKALEGDRELEFLMIPPITRHTLKDIALGPGAGINQNFELNAEFDIDGDGNLDRLYKLESHSNYMNARSVLARLGASDSEFRSNAHVSPELWYLPCQLDAERPQLADCPPLSQKHDGAGIPMKWHQGDVFFLARYTHMLPFLFDEAVYFLMSSESEDSKDYSGVIRLIPDRSYASECLLQKATENF